MPIFSEKFHNKYGIEKRGGGRGGVLVRLPSSPPSIYANFMCIVLAIFFLHSYEQYYDIFMLILDIYSLQFISNITTF